MPDKQQPLGVCDFCHGPIPRDRWHTAKGAPRLHCSDECRAFANSRAGAPIRSRKAKARVARGEWQNPHLLNPPTSEEQSRRSRLGRQREVEAGTWRNPALTPAARRKLSKPRKHTGALARAIEKLNHRRMAEAGLTETEHRAWLRYKRQRRQARLDEVRRYYRERYQRQRAEMSEAEREAQRARWREQNKRRRSKK